MGLLLPSFLKVQMLLSHRRRRHELWKVAVATDPINLEFAKIASPGMSGVGIFDFLTDGGW